MNQLIPIENVNAIEVFSNQDSIHALLTEIRNQATDFKPDTSTVTGRKQIASQAYKVSQSKTVIDKAGKALTDEWAKKKKLVDNSRKIARDFCDDLRDEIRKPLTEYEAEQERLAAEAKLKAQVDADEIEAYAQNELFDREVRVREMEAKIEAERIERERIEVERKAEAERKAREERIRKEAEQRAKHEAEEAIRRERESAEQAKREAEEAEQRAKEQAERAECDRKAAEEDARREQQRAIERERRRAKEEADRVERERLRLIEENEREAQRRAADKENRRTINNAIVTALVKCGISQESAKKVVVLVASGNVPSISIRY